MKTNIKLYLGIAVFALLISITGLTMAIWRVTYVGAENRLTVGCFSLEFNELTNSVTLLNTYPISDEAGQNLPPYTFTIENTCSIAAAFNITLDVVDTETNMPLNRVRVSLSGDKTLTPATLSTLEENVDIKEPAGIRVSHILASGILDVGEEKEFDLRMWIDEEAGNAVQGRTIEARLTIASVATLVPTTPAKELILENNDVIIDRQPNFNVGVTNANRDTEEGVFRIEDEDGYSYIFRGTHAGLNNNVIFAGHQWKILRIEGNGNIRLIYNGECPNNTCTINGVTAGADTSIVRIDNGQRGSQFNAQYNHNRFVGYMFGESSGDFDEQHANTNPSTIKGVINEWFAHHFPANSSQRNLVANNTMFCVDRSFAPNNTGDGLGNSVTHYGTMGRLPGGTTGNIPRLTCPRSEDRLELPIGLITGDEASMVGSHWMSGNNDSFLRSNSPYWIMSPSYFTGAHARVMFVNPQGSLNEGIVFTPGIDLRPVIALNSDTIFESGGNGSAETPFVVRID